MPTISQLLQYILSKRYGEEVRGAIHDAIEKCYQDVNSATLREDAFQAALQDAIDHGDIPGMVIADNSISGAKIQDGTIPLRKLSEAVQITVDSALSGSSTNPVQNKVIKGAIDELNGSLDSFMKGGTVEWVQGAIDRLSGTGTTSQTAIRTSDYIPSATLRIGCNSDYKFLVHAWNEGTYVGHMQTNGEFGKDTTYGFSTSYAINKELGYVYKIVLYPSAGGNIATTEGENCTIYSPTDITLTKEGSAADAKITGDAIRGFEESLNATEDKIDDAYDASHIDGDNEEIEFTSNEKGYIYDDGSVRNINDANYHYSDLIAVNTGEQYKITGTMAGLNGHYWCMYKDGVKVSISDTPGSSSGVAKEFDITIPSNVNQLRVGWYRNASHIYKKSFKPLKSIINSISILFVGNSLTLDCIAYLPYLLKTFYPEVSFKFYMWYNGGYTLENQYDVFTNDTACEIFSICENRKSWTSQINTAKMSELLTEYKFDIICMQDYYNVKTSYTVDDLTGLNNCIEYITSHYQGGNGLKFVSLFHAPMRSAADSKFNLTKTAQGVILRNTVIDDMIPTGIALYRALSTELDELGSSGHLSPDGIHAQEGLPCLLQTYSALLWLFDILGITKSIYGLPFKMTQAIWNTINVPGANGTVIEGTDAQNRLAQQIAIKAYKEGKKVVINNLSEY